MTPRENACTAQPFGSKRALASCANRQCMAGRRQDGAFAIMLAPLILVLIGFTALAIDVGGLYSRNVDLHGIAKAAALAAARELNGTPDGITAARNQAKATAEKLSYRNGTTVKWHEEALSFGTSHSTDDWIDAGSAQASPSGRYYARVDTRRLGDEINTVTNAFMPVLSGSLSSVRLGAVAVAGRTTINVAPIAICAMSTDPAASRTNPGQTTAELVEYGFRRGVSYDLMQLNPDGETPARFLVNPVSAPGASSPSFDSSAAGPFVCVGKMWIPALRGGPIRVSSLPASAPLASLFAQLNSRFDEYPANACNPNGAPSDYNIKAYAYDVSGGVTWMAPATGSPAAATTKVRQRLETVADLPSPPSDITPGSYGPLWSFAKAAKFPSNYKPGTPEPASGYATFGTGDWPTLYKLGPTASGYPTPLQGGTPYKATKNTYAAPQKTPVRSSVDARRVVNVPLLACPVPSGSNVAASVVAVGKFFMTVRATQDSFIGEFAGVVADESFAGQVELYQ